MGDSISVVEAAYDLTSSEQVWLQALVERMQAVVGADLGLSAYTFEDLGERGTRIGPAVQSTDTRFDVVGSVAQLAESLEARREGRSWLKAKTMGALAERMVRLRLRESPTLLQESERASIGPRRWWTLGTPIRDQFILMAGDTAGRRATCFVGGLTRTRRLVPARRAMYSRLAAHVEAASRLRLRLPQLQGAVAAPVGGAVLDAGAKVIHAEGEAQAPAERARLSEAALRLSDARSRKLGRGPDALAVWQGLVDGRWSLVERFDSDGKRFLLAHRNEPSLTDPRGLTRMEASVVALAARGFADKMVAYRLGVADGTVSSHLARAMRKLGIRDRVELVRLLGPCRRG